MINIVLSIYEIWPTLSYPFFRIWSTLSYLFIKYDQPCLIYLWVWGLICHLAFTESAPENLSTTKTVSNNYFVNKYEFFKSTPMIFLSTSTANENSHQHQLQPINTYIIDFSHWVDYFSYLTPFILSTEVKWLSSTPSGNDPWMLFRRS